MTALALALALGLEPPGSPPPVWYRPWRIVETDAVHVGLRPAGYLDNELPGGQWEVGAGATLQVTAAALSL